MIYFLEQNPDTLALVLDTIRSVGFEADGFSHPSAFWSAVEERRPRLILLDFLLPEENGLFVLRKLRADAATRSIPIMMLTDKGTEYDAVVALDAGADDYMTKPFRMMELLARIRALLRRAEGFLSEDPDYQIGELYVSLSRHLVQVGGQPVRLTYKEFEMLCLLLENRGFVLTRDRILDKVWRDAPARESRTVDVHIRTLRRKLGTAGSLIETIRGIGYKFSDT